MLDILFHIFFAFFVFTGVVGFSIFSWLKIHQADTDSADRIESLNHELSSDLAQSF